MKRAQLPVLSPCSADWDTMTSAGRARFCAECQTHVHHISAMSRSEAARFLHAHAGQDLCVRYAYDGDGNVRFADSANTAITTAQALWPSLRALAAASTLLVGASHLQPSSSAPTVKQPDVRCELKRVDDAAAAEQARLHVEQELQRAKLAAESTEIMGRISVSSDEITDEMRAELRALRETLRIQRLRKKGNAKIK